MSMNYKYMRKAIEAAREGINNGGNPFGCCIVVNGKIVCTAYNTTDQDHDPTAHAEINGIRRACKSAGVLQLKNATIYTTAEPCPMCLTAIYWAGIKRVFYGIGSHELTKYGFDEITLRSDMLSSYYPGRIEMAGGALEGEVEKLFEQWASDNRVQLWFKKRSRRINR